jgi:NADPH:quinone reductase-like Zn-dependent oxidoreductase
MVAGLPLPIRLAGFGVRRPNNRVPGVDVAGRIEAVGRGVTKLRPGDEVYGVGTGSFAEYVRARRAGWLGKRCPGPGQMCDPHGRARGNARRPHWSS